MEEVDPGQFSDLGGDCHKRDDKSRVIVLADRSSGSL